MQPNPIGQSFDVGYSNAFMQQNGRYPTPEEIQAAKQEQGQAQQQTSGPSTAQQVGQVAAGVGMAGLGHQAGRYVVNQGAQALGYGAQGANAGAQLAAPTVLGASDVAGQAALQAPTVAGAQAVGTGAQGATAGTTTTSGAQLGASMLGTAATVVGGLAGAYGLYDSINNSYQHKQTGSDLAMTTAGGAASGAGLGFAIGTALGGPVLGLALGAALGGGAGFGSGIAGSGKDAHQITRDAIRDRMVGYGLYEHTPATQGVHSMGGDGGYRLPDGRRNFEIVAGQAEGAPERDYTQDEGYAVGALNGLGYVLAGGADTEENKIKAAGNAVGLLYNHLDNQGPDGVTADEIRGLYEQAGFGHQTAFEAMNLMAQNGAISQEEQAAAHNALNELYGQEYYTPNDEEEAQRAIEAAAALLYR